MVTLHTSLITSRDQQQQQQFDHLRVGFILPIYTEWNSGQDRYLNLICSLCLFTQSFIPSPSFFLHSLSLSLCPLIWMHTNTHWPLITSFFFPCLCRESETRVVGDSQSDRGVVGMCVSVVSCVSVSVCVWVDCILRCTIAATLITEVTLNMILTMIKMR